MNSRLRTENATIFDVCCMVNYGTRTSELSSEIKVLYPLEFSDDSVLRSIKQFCFPYQDSKSGENEAVQLFTFVFTDSQSLHTFGYCRFTPRTNSCLCILSGYFWVNLFYNLLNHISTVFTNASLSDVESLLTNAYHMDIPTPGSKLKLNACTAIARFSDKIPDLSCLPTLGEDKFLLEYFNAINERQMIQLYSSLLKERRIIFTASKLNQLSSCIFGLYKLFYPFHWQNLFIPILPKDLTDMLMAPMPFLIGIPKQLFLEMNQTELGDVVIMDLDEKVLTSPYQDKLPMDVYNFLRNRLKRLSDVFLTDSFARSFLQTNVLLFGNYTSGFVKDSSATYSWDREKFVENSRQNIRPYLQSLIGTEGVQYFERFIEERLHALNNDNVIIDEFEKEIQLMGIHRFHGGVLSKPPEFFQQAVSSVKGNAFDVFGALKDQFQSISVKEKSSTMIRPSEKETTHRRHRPLSSNGRSKAKIKAIDPLSIDTSQFNFEHPTLASDPQTSDAASVHSVDDLIDLKDDEPSSSLHPHPSLSKNIYSSPNLQQSATMSINNSTLKPIVHELGFTNVASQLVHPSNRNPETPAIVKQRNKWQTFE